MVKDQSHLYKPLVILGIIGEITNGSQYGLLTIYEFEWPKHFDVYRSHKVATVYNLQLNYYSRAN